MQMRKARVFSLAEDNRWKENGEKDADGRYAASRGDFYFTLTRCGESFVR